MKAQHSTGVSLGLAALVAQAHRIATGSEISLEQAAIYFHDPAQFARTIQASGALVDPKRSGRLRELLLPTAGMEKRNEF